MLVDGTSPLGEGDKFIIEQLSKVKVPVYLVINKVDLVKNEETLKDNIQTYKEAYPFKGGITISASEGFNVEKLKKMIIDVLPLGPEYYPADQLLDKSVRFVVSEIIREKILLLTKEEVPHSVAVTVESFKPNNKNEDMIDIRADIIVERPSQKKIIIGKNGEMIKKIGTLSRIDIVKFLDKKVYLDLFVKVESDWRNNKTYLKEFGYKIEK